MLEFSQLERYVFALFFLLACGTFIFLARKIANAIFAGKPESDRLSAPGTRFIRLITEVLFQRRVIGFRPVVGMMHATVFLAFMLFSIETVNMFLEPFGLDFIHLFSGEALETFRNLVMIIAAVCTFSMIGLVFRRFVMVSISPNPKSYESGFVAILIIILMLTYIDLNGTGYLDAKLNWWIHAVILLIFPVLILNSKHRHIFLAPVTVFLRKPRLWDVEKMNLDFENAESEDDIQFGLETLADIPWKLRLDFFSCVECKRCTDNCPAAIAGQELRPSELIIAGRNALLNNKSDDPVIGTVISEKALSQCTSCMACENVCPVGVEHSQLLFGTRTVLTLAMGTGPATEFHKTMSNYSNPFSAGPDVRKSLIDELGIPIYEKGKTEYLLWLGCVWSYNPDFKKAVDATSKILRKAGVSFGVLIEESCSGHHSRKQGEEMQFQMLAEENVELLKSNEVKNVITGCPHCLNTFKHDYKDFFKGYSVNVIHHSEIFKGLIEMNAISFKNDSVDGSKMTYHDPCYLGRYESIMDEPREVIQAAGNALGEADKNREYSYCCGGGAAGFTVESKEEKRIDQERKDQIKATGAETLITSCPECKMMLAGAVETTMDISELLLDALAD